MLRRVWRNILRRKAWTVFLLTVVGIYTYSSIVNTTWGDGFCLAMWLVILDREVMRGEG